MNIISYFILVLVIIASMVNSFKPPERTLLDDLFQPMRHVFYQIPQIIQKYQNHRPVEQYQTEYPENYQFFCDAKNGPGKRSSVRPTSVHQLRPGDIDIVAGMGDSMMAGIGLYGNRLLDLFVENRGLVYSIGGESTWRKYLTLPNILKEFNPNLYGFSLTSGMATNRAVKFNVAEAGAMSRDMPWQAKLLYKRMITDPKVNMTDDWKMLSIMIGANDFCLDICYENDISEIIEKHRTDVLKFLRYLRDHIPRLIINYISVVDVAVLQKIQSFSDKPLICHYSHYAECPCFIDKIKSKSLIDSYKKIIQDWRKIDEEIIKKDEFNNDQFTINWQTFMSNVSLPYLENGSLDYRYFSTDCFHFSQRTHSKMSVGLWNNLLEKDGFKTTVSLENNEDIFKCPTEENPYISTRGNT